MLQLTIRTIYRPTHLALDSAGVKCSLLTLPLILVDDPSFVSYVRSNKDLTFELKLPLQADGDRQRAMSDFVVYTNCCSISQLSLEATPLCFGTYSSSLEMSS